MSRTFALISHIKSHVSQKLKLTEIDEFDHLIYILRDAPTVRFIDGVISLGFLSISTLQC